MSRNETLTRLIACTPSSLAAWLLICTLARVCANTLVFCYLWEEFNSLNKF